MDIEAIEKELEDLKKKQKELTKQKKLLSGSKDFQEALETAQKLSPDEKKKLAILINPRKPRKKKDQIIRRVLQGILLIL